jgi:acetyl esterase/lipase
MSRIARRDLLTWGGTLLSVEPVTRAATPAADWAPRLTEGVKHAWTSAESVPLWPSEPPGASQFAAQPLPDDWPPSLLRNVAQPGLHVFHSHRPTGQAVLVVPGGSYTFISWINEGVRIAERLTAAGMTVFVLTYRLPGEGWPARADVPLQDAQRAMRVIRARARQFGIDAGTLSVMGFSAGGHLAATLATRHEERVYERQDDADDSSARPFAAALIYPVVTMQTPWTHAQSRQQLLGDNPSDADIERRSAELRVDDATPPVFIVHAMDDGTVPIENSLRMMDALRAAKRTVEAHLLQEGGHGFGTGNPHTVAEHWLEWFPVWLSRIPAGR